MYVLRMQFANEPIYRDPTISLRYDGPSSNDGDRGRTRQSLRLRRARGTLLSPRPGMLRTIPQLAEKASKA